MKKYIIALALSALSLQAMAKSSEVLKNPRPGVLCDKYFCADKNGVSYKLTKKYLGQKPGDAIRAQGEFDKTEFTFSNGIFCDVKEKKCHTDRYFNNDGARSPVSDKYTHLLFPAK